VRISSAVLSVSANTLWRYKVTKPPIGSPIGFFFTDSPPWDAPTTCCLASASPFDTCADRCFLFPPNTERGIEQTHRGFSHSIPVSMLLLLVFPGPECPVEFVYTLLKLISTFYFSALEPLHALSFAGF